MQLPSIARLTDGSPLVSPKAPQKVEDAVHEMVTKVIDALTEDGMGWTRHRTLLEQAEPAILGVLAAVIDVAVGEWEEQIDQIAALDDLAARRHPRGERS
ncbi:hypothetical protein [Corynebacterium doosanense]|uniref:Uncharacterized protein n=1 Tax=Corynebacterium doosanense CAU 212 = DSM 45436 TaxID=558173 RepID=A0A097IJ87_9CORY|nr:hypothetical protein [Corynebacterium doosanense]AIT62173.1 hypothetical protein CDOO_01865 [Corynebacterium doosanense CAU 212 = DSM 45436]